MISQVKVTNHLGEQVTFELRSPEKSGFFIKNITGIGAVKSNITVSESLYEDGGYFNSSRRFTRNIVFEFGFFADHPTYTIEMIRNKTYRLFPPNKLITIEFTTDTKVATAQGYVETNEPNIFSKEESAQISIICPDPNFYGPAVSSQLINQTGKFEFPFSNESLTEKLIEFGTVSIVTNPQVLYTGDIPTGLILYVQFTGPVTNLVIHNSNGDSMLIESARVQTVMGGNFVNNDLLTIDTRKGSKSAILTRGGIQYNLMNAIATSADWFEIDRGLNEFTLTADANVGNARVTAWHKLVYGGV